MRAVLALCMNFIYTHTNTNNKIKLRFDNDARHEQHKRRQASTTASTKLSVFLKKNFGFCHIMQIFCKVQKFLFSRKKDYYRDQINF